MRGSSDIFLVLIGLLILYLGITGKLDCFAGLGACLFGQNTQPTNTGARPAVYDSRDFSLSPLPRV